MRRSRLWKLSICALAVTTAIACRPAPAAEERPNIVLIFAALAGPELLVPDRIEGGFCHRQIGNGDGTCLRKRIAAEMVDQRCLSGAVRSDEGDGSPFFNLQGNMINSVNAFPESSDIPRCQFIDF